MTEKFGVKNVKKFIDLLICFGTFAGASLVGKKFLFSLGATWACVSTLKSIFFGPEQIDFTQLWPEVTDLSPEESQDLVSYIKVKLSLPDDHKDLERTIETVVEQAGKLYITVGSIVTYWHTRLQAPK